MPIIGPNGWGPRHPWGNGHVIAPMDAAIADSSYGKIDLTDLIAMFYVPIYGKRLKRGRDRDGRPEYVIMPEPPPGGRAAAPEGRPAPAGGYSRDNFGIGDGAPTYEMAEIELEKSLREDMTKHGYFRMKLPESEILRMGEELKLRNPEHDAVETGLGIYRNEMRFGLDGACIDNHELLGKHLRLAYGIPHGRIADRVIRPLEIPMVMARARGEADVLDRFAERASKDYMRAMMN
ncbi:MAG: hypothetical protein HY517_03000 [Candidatus Aenigmarchaeota archaeon]|nr:hypothetical protein [Candidatus Aenigmarchaeota archaeon]